MNFTICASGNLGFVVLHYLINKSVDVALVLTDSHSESIISFCKENNIRCFKGNPRNGRFVEWKSKEKIQICHLLSINYLFILDKEIMDLISGYAINFHGSLLPKYRGRTPHVWAIINGEDRCGITAHQMNDKCDDGDIVRQVVVDIEDTDTGASVLEKYNRIYPTLVLDVVNDINLNRLVFKPQDSSKATYFSKRTPEDGEINWNWQKERIRNWVRAQAKPYPGAFTYYNGVKVVINKVEYVDDGFLDTMPNGLIISFKSGKPIVKTPNGAVLLLDIFGDVNFELNEMFGHQHIDNETNTLCGGGEVR
jgi:methionyl-tRNA formyltransferase